MQNIGADDNLNYNRDFFYAILSGEDPELMQEKEIARLQKLDADHKAEEDLKKPSTEQ